MNPGLIQKTVSEKNNVIVFIEKRVTDF